MRPFEPPGLSRFNRLVEGEVSNAFLGGFIVLIILVELSNICDTLMYGKDYLQKSTIDRYLIFRRISSMRGLFRLATGHEFPSDQIRTSPAGKQRYHRTNYRLESAAVVSDEDGSDSVPSDRKRPHAVGQMGIPIVEKRYAKLFLPCLARLFLLVAEFAAIYAGTTVRTTVTAASGFDPRIGIPTGPIGRTASTGCDNYLVRTRAQEQSGEVLKCVSRITKERAPFIPSTNETRIQLSVNVDDNSALFEISNKEYKETKIAFDITISSVGQGVLNIAPLRPDIDPIRTNQVFNAIMEGALQVLKIEYNASAVLQSAVWGGTRDIEYSAVMDHSQARIAAALVSQLRGMDLELNSTGPPWAFESERAYTRRGDVVIAVLGSNRVAHGGLMIIAAVLILLRFVVNYCFTTFDEVAYIGIKEIIGDDCIMGPTARNPRTTARVVKLQRFSDGCTGHIGFQPATASQEPVDDFIGCEVVLGTTAV